MSHPFNHPLAFESNSNQTATYSEVIDFYLKIADHSSIVQCQEFGMTDVGRPLHEVVVSTDEVFSPEDAVAQDKVVYFVNNAIHPGEPCGVEATMLWLRDLVNGKMALSEDVVLVIVPFYNIGGGLNRNSHTRTNQLGPESYGFRGNVRNLDLNRDFVKCDSKNARSFNQLFNKWSPHVQVDNHTSNGADYQYTMTLIATQKDKLAAPVSEVLTASMLPFLYPAMEEKGWEMTPYVYSRETPDEGIYGFMDYARYSSGYAALHHTISFMPETHMLKPYEDRVWSTYHFLQAVLEYVTHHPDSLLTAKKAAIEEYKNMDRAPLNWRLDTKAVDSIEFKGYEASYEPSKVSGHPRLKYDHNRPYTKQIPFYDTYQTSLEVETPKAYLIPQAYDAVAERLAWNGVEVERLQEDEVFEVEVYYITGYEDIPAYEGHYLHHSIEVRKEVEKIQFLKGDYKINCNQASNRYIFETLEPQAPDGFFAWNFFDGILMQKEHFSAYVFEDLATELLENDADLRERFEKAKAEDPSMLEDGRVQLQWVYKNSPHYEPTHNRFPVMRVGK